MSIYTDTSSDALMKTRRFHGVVNRVVFDPRNPDHLVSLRIFLDTGTWGAVSFHVEHPYTDVPMTVLTKLAREVLDVALPRPKMLEAA